MPISLIDFFVLAVPLNRINDGFIPNTPDNSSINCLFALPSMAFADNLARILFRHASYPLGTSVLFDPGVTSKSIIAPLSVSFMVFSYDMVSDYVVLSGIMWL